MMLANEGRWIDHTADYLRDNADWLDASQYQNCCRFYVRCGGCPWGVELWFSQDLLTEYPMPEAMKTQGWAVDPLRCPYCTGQMQRPDDPYAAPYPVTEGG